MNNLLNDIKNNWAMIAFICAMIIWYANVNSRLIHVEALAEENKSTLELVRELRTDIAVIKVDINYIKDKVK